MANLGIEKMIRRRVGCLELLPKSDGVTPECVEAASNMLDDTSIAAVLQSQRPNSDLSQLAVRTTTSSLEHSFNNVHAFRYTYARMCGCKLRSAYLCFNMELTA